MRLFINRLLRSDRAFFAILQTLLTQFGILLLNLATGVVTARSLGADGRGLFAAMTTWPQLLSMLSFSGLGSALIYCLRKRPDQTSIFTGAALAAGTVTSSLSILLALIFIPYTMGNYDRSTVLVTLWCLPSVYVYIFQNTIKQVFIGLGRFDLCNFLTILPQFLFLVGLLGILLFGQMTAVMAVYALLGGGFLALLMFLNIFFSITKPLLDFSVPLKEAASYAFRAAPTDFVGTLAGLIDRLILIGLVQPTELGYYVVAFSFSRLVGFIQPAINTVLFSSMSDGDGGRAKIVHDHAFRFSLVGLIMTMVTLIAFDRYLLFHVYGKDFEPAIWLFRVLAVEATVGVLSQVVTQLFLSQNQPGFISWVQFFTFGILLAALALLVPMLGAIGAAFSLLIAGLFKLLALFGGIHFKLRLSLPRIYLARSDVIYLRNRMM